MSTEAPPLEIPAVEPIPPQPEPPKPSESLLSSIRVIRPGLDKTDPAPEPVVEEPKPPVEEPPKEEPKAEIPKVETPKEPADDPTKGMSEPAAKRFKKIEQRATEAEKEREQYRTQLESIQKEHVQLQEQLREVEAMRRQYDQMKEESEILREEIRKTNIERDPQFKRDHDDKIISLQTQMLEMAHASGIDRNEFVNAVNTGNETALEDIRSSLAPHQQRVWDGNRIEIDRIAAAKRSAIQNNKESWERIKRENEKSEAQSEELRRARLVSMAKDAVKALWTDVPNLDKAGLEVKNEIEEWIVHTVTKEPQPNIARHLLIGKLAQNVVEGQKTEIDRLTTELDKQTKEMEEMKEKLGEQETFIKEMSSRTPRPQGGGNPSPVEQNGSLLSSVRVRLPGR